MQNELKIAVKVSKIYENTVQTVINGCNAAHKSFNEADDKQAVLDALDTEAAVKFAFFQYMQAGLKQFGLADIDDIPGEYSVNADGTVDYTPAPEADEEAPENES